MPDLPRGPPDTPSDLGGERPNSVLARAVEAGESGRGCGMGPRPKLVAEPPHADQLVAGEALLAIRSLLKSAYSSVRTLSAGLSMAAISPGWLKCSAM